MSAVGRINPLVNHLAAPLNLRLDTSTAEHVVFDHFGQPSHDWPLEHAAPDAEVLDAIEVVASPFRHWRGLDVHSLGLRRTSQR